MWVSNDACVIHAEKITIFSVWMLLRWCESSQSTSSERVFLDRDMRVIQVHSRPTLQETS